MDYTEQFIRLNCSLMSDYKMMKLNADMKCMGLGLYLETILFLRKQQEYKHDFNELDLLADQWGATVENLQHLIKDFDLFLITEDGYFRCLYLDEVMGYQSKLSELKEMIDEANISVTTDMLFDIYNSETLSGLRGNEIIKERESLPYKGKIYVSREDIEERVRANQISVVEHPTGYCFNPKCDRICSSDRSTKTCSHEVVTRDKALKRANFRIRLIDRFNALNNGQFQL
jgi:hypothetical protein